MTTSKQSSTDYPKYIPRRFHIFSPLYGVWKQYGWPQGVWGLGLKKKRIDELANSGMTVIVSYNITKDKISDEYTIKAEKVREFPINECRDGTRCYAVPLTALNKR
jgi:hypothetical protein